MNNQDIDEKVSALKSILLKGLIVVGAGLALGGAYLAYNHHLETKNVEAAALLYQAQAMEKAEAPRPATPEDVGALGSFDATKIIAWESGKLDAYEKILAKIDSDFSGTPTWALAQLRRGKIAAAKNNYEAAEKIFSAVVDTNLKTGLFAGFAADALGVLLEDQNKLDKALEVFHNAGSDLKNPLRPLALLGEARVLQNLGKPGAAEVYEKVVKDYPETAYSRRARVLRSLLGVPAAGAR